MVKDNNKALADYENAPDSLIARDRMRYTKNKLSANLALLAIVFNVFYFVMIYKTDVSNYFSRFFIGLSVLYNLVFMLVSFLASESVKNYKMSFAIVMIVVGVLQILRIFYIPLNGLKFEEYTVFTTSKFVWLTVFLSLSAVCLFVGGIVGVIRIRALNKHLVTISKQG